MSDSVHAVAVAKKLEQRAAELVTIIEQDMILHGFVTPAIRAIMMNAVGRRLLFRAAVLEGGDADPR